jgi:hypothetical protein
MYSLLSLLPVKRLVYEQAPALALAWVIAELFFKFHSFTLECGAFLAIWFVLDALIQRLVDAGRARRPQALFRYKK